MLQSFWEFELSLVLHSVVNPLLLGIAGLDDTLLLGEGLFHPGEYLIHTLHLERKLLACLVALVVGLLQKVKVVSHLLKAVLRDALGSQRFDVLVQSFNEHTALLDL